MDLKNWEERKGVTFLKTIGVKSADKVVDFGCRAGHYTIPAARLVGKRGIVYAIDKDQDALEELQRKATAENLNNIELIKASDNLELGFGRESIDVTLLYDVLHYFNEKKRQKLYQEVVRVLKIDGFLSVYPKHTVRDGPLMEFEKVDVENLTEEIQRSGFVFDYKHCDRLSHDNEIIDGCILNFKKNNE